MNQQKTTDLKFNHILKNLEEPKLDIYQLYLQHYEEIPNFIGISDAKLTPIHHYFKANYKQLIEAEHSFLKFSFSNAEHQENQWFYYLKNTLIQFDFSANTIYLMYEKIKKTSLSDWLKLGES